MRAPRDVGARGAGSRIRRPWALASLLLVVAAAILPATGCAYLMTERALSPQISADRGEDGVAIEEAPWAVYIIHLRLAGDPNEVRWEDRGRTISVRSRPLSTTMWSFGPLLPILPRFGTSQPADLEICASVSGAPGRTLARLADFALSLPGRSEPLRPSGVRIPASDVSPLRALDADCEAVVELEGWGSMRLTYPVDSTAVQEAQLVLRFASEDGSWSFERSVLFVRGSTTFVMTIP